MLFTEAETAEWNRRTDDAYQEQPGDTWDDRWKRRAALTDACRNERIRRMRARPADVLRAVVTHTGERASVGLTSQEVWGDPALLAERYAAANTPETRWLVRTMLSAVLEVPRSWGRSATTRFFRGTGKQKDAKYPGLGVLSADRGWAEREAETLVRMYYEGDVGALFLDDASPDPYSREEADQIDEGGGNRFAATRKDRDDAFIADLIARLDAEGVREPVVASKPPPKPRKAKQFDAGDVVTQGNLRDVPEGSHLRMTIVCYEANWRRPGLFEGDETTYEMVFLSRETGKATVRPVMKGKAFGARQMPSASMYDTDYRRNEVVTTYVGPWEGEVLDVELAREGWNPTKTRKVRRRLEGKYPDEKVLPA